MILHALKEYYERKAADPDSGIAPEGWENKEIPFVIVLDRTGNLVKIEDTREGIGRKKRSRVFRVPQGEKKTSGVKANLLWDSAGYIFGIEKNDKKQRAPEKRKAFYERLEKELSGLPATKSILAFTNSITGQRLEEENAWEEIFETNPNLTFRFFDDTSVISETPEFVQLYSRIIENREESKTSKGLCLITGERSQIADLHTVIKGVQGAQSSGANIVSFNLSAFRSYNKKQGFNAPICKSSAFAYTTALNTLLAKDSKQRLKVGDATMVFWSEAKTAFENDFSSFFSEPAKDNPDYGTEKIRALYQSLSTGAYLSDDGDIRFYVLGLAPNAARISIRFWQEGRISEFSAKIRQHFEDLQIVKSEREPEFYSLWRLLVNTATQNKTENVPPNMAGELMQAVLSGTPYPATLLQAVLRRIKSDVSGRVKPVRASLIKAYLNRYNRFYGSKEKEIIMALDVDQPSVGYQLGRLFAALEKIQEEANPGINATIRERYYSAACASPVSVFANLMRLKNHHLAKLENKGRVVSMEKLLSEILGRLSDFPAHLNLHEQGRFAIGYYHQRHEFFTKKTEN